MMNAKEIIKEINEKSELLNEENEKDFEDMLLYIRIASTKSELETETILLQLLDHILEAQEEGRTVKDVFGEDLKTYCQEIIDEIPKETKKRQIKFGFQIVFMFLGIMVAFNGLISTVLYYGFSLGTATRTYHVGTIIVVAIINVIVLWGFIKLIFFSISRTLFKKTEKKPNKWLEFFELWLICTVSIGIIVVVTFVTPAIGPEFSILTYTLIFIGIALYGMSWVLKERKQAVTV